MFRISAIFLFLGSSLALSAQVVIATDLGTNVVYQNSIVEYAPAGQSFSTGSTTYYLTSATLTLSSVVQEAARSRRPSASSSMVHATASNRKPGRALGIFNVSGCASACTQVSLWSDNGGPGPGTLLTTSTTTELDTALPVTPGNVTFAFSHYQLSPNTRYWIVVASSSNSVAQWWGTDDSNGTALANEYYYSVDGVTPDAEETDGFLMSVSGTTTGLPTTPSPSSLILTLVGLLCVGMYFTWRKSEAEPQN